MITVTDPLKPLKPGSAGFERKEVEIAILDDFDRPVATDEVGEISVRPRSPGTIFSGYWRNTEATVNAWRNFWYHTGDLGRKDEDGEVFFLDRKADYLRVRGERISSFEASGSPRSRSRTRSACTRRWPRRPRLRSGLRART